MPSLVELLGEQLQTSDGLGSTADLLAGKQAIGLYFSAHWCPPCRGFTPKLAEMYTKAFKAKGMEIIFVSSDKDDSSFGEYYKEQPWLALPFADRDRKAKLSKDFKVQGIPTLVILGSDGEVITKDGREAVMKDQNGDKFPWKPPTPEEKAQTLLKHLGDVVKTDKKAIGLYFSAHWCPPCRAFTPELAKWYNEGLKDNMQIIFISSDKSQDDFDSYAKEMPWDKLEFSKRDAKSEISDLCGVQGIPSLVVISPDGKIITTEGRGKVTNDKKGETLPDGWLPAPFNDVNDDPSPLNEEECVIILGSNKDAWSAVEKVAVEIYNQNGKDVEKMPQRFFKGPDGGIVEQVRKLTGVDSGTDKLILLNIPDSGSYYECATPADQLTPDNVKSFLADVKAGSVEKKNLKK